MKKTKFIFITGGVISGLGKGIITASLGKLLRLRGYRIDLLKLDPYLNQDAGTMSPAEHGEVFVTEDGAETDLDIGNYERFTGLKLSGANNVTAGQIYSSILEKEREGENCGKTVQIIPHVTDEIKSKFYVREDSYDFVLVEVGGTVGDIESLPFLEGVRQFIRERRRNCLNLHITYVPFIPSSGEQKTKPTQNSIKELRSLGLSPNLLICRTSHPEIDLACRQKLSTFCDLEEDSTFICPDADIYSVPLLLEEQKIVDKVEELLEIPSVVKQDIINKNLSIFYPQENISLPKKTIAIASKYNNQEAHTSLLQMIKHCSVANQFSVEVKFIDCDEGCCNMASELFGVDAVVLPGGFGGRGVETKIKISQYCRANNIPLFGICLGMQCIVIGALRDHNEIDYKINSQEFSYQSSDVAAVILMEDQKKVTQRGGTLKLGEYCQIFTPGNATLSKEAYQDSSIELDRYRHRYEVNPLFENYLKDMNLIISARTEEGLVTVIESRLPLVLATQYHPEFTSKMEMPHPLFNKFCSLI